MSNHATEWENAKTAYFNLTGEKKPKEVFVKFFTTSHTKLSGTIKKCDKLANEGGVTVSKASPKAFAARLKDFESAFTEFKSSTNEYITLLEKLILEEKKNKPKGLDEQNVLVKMTTDRQKGLKMLKTKLQDFHSTYTQLAITYLADAKNLDSIQKVEALLGAGIKKGFTKAAACSAAIKSNPTVANYNTEMDQGIRSLTTALGTFKTLDKMYTNKNLPVPQEVTDNIVNANLWIVRLSPWADGAKRVLQAPVNLADEKTLVLKELGDAMELVKKCMMLYQAYL